MNLVKGIYWLKSSKSIYVFSFLFRMSKCRAGRFLGSESGLRRFVLNRRWSYSNLVSQICRKAKVRLVNKQVEAEKEKRTHDQAPRCDPDWTVIHTNIGPAKTATSRLLVIYHPIHMIHLVNFMRYWLRQLMGGSRNSDDRQAAPSLYI